MKALSFLKGKFCDKPALEVSGKLFSRDLLSSKLNNEFSESKQVQLYPSSKYYYNVICEATD